ncbi:hypothetical protein CF394_09660 [Tetzosporium hominis]|uniref:Uncharacterized protein n=1 Tax=Tetzosporium hominis TaxID=2020506 RepID=A0A264W1K1_9BACL|nr:hypothetical protein [Tetzosporium hominis]OZS77476.1 hypothetical protein CF394_09660 [Tetzosporium hominis]
MSKLLINFPENVMILDSTEFDVVNEFSMPFSYVTKLPKEGLLFNERDQGIIHQLMLNRESLEIETHSEGSHLPSHVIANAGRLAVFNDGDGRITVFTSPKANQPTKLLFQVQVPAHHGVAIPLQDGTILVSTKEAGSEAALGDRFVRLDEVGQVVKKYEAAPAIHGETVVEYNGNLFAVMGAEAALNVYEEATDTVKVCALPDDTTRSGMLVSENGNPWVMANYSTIADPMSNIGLILYNIENHTVYFVEVPSDYYFSYLVHQSKGYLIGKDGYLYEVDLETQQVGRSQQLWDSSSHDADNEPRIAIDVSNQRLFITNPFANEVLMVLLKEWSVSKVLKLEDCPNEIYYF